MGSLIKRLLRLAVSALSAVSPPRCKARAEVSEPLLRVPKISCLSSETPCSSPRNSLIR